MRIEWNDYYIDKLVETAKGMAVAARTAPKGRGRDHLHILILTGEDKDTLAQNMEMIGREKDIEFFVRDSGNLKNVPVVFLIGAQCDPLEVPNCGFCGFADCRENRESEKAIPCAFSTGDLGIAVGSAAAYAAHRHVDNRVMFSAGKTALDLGLFPPPVKVAYGIPLSATGKSPFFDR